MPIPDWRKLVLDAAVLVEPVSEPDRIILWLRQFCHDGFQYWERISTIPHAEVSTTEGICTTPATAVPVRQKCRGLLGRLFGRWWSAAEENGWVLPNGETAEQCGVRQTNLQLAWPENEGTPLNENRIKAAWPQNQRLQQLGPNLFLVGITEASEPAGSPVSSQTPDIPSREAVEHLVIAARQAANHHAEATALTDLGVFYLRHHDPERAVPLLEEALALVRQLEDRAGEIDTLSNLGHALLVGGQAQYAQELCEQAVMLARERGDRIAELSALERLALAYGGLGDHNHAILFYEESLYLARVLGDFQREAEMFWRLAIEHAELGRRDQAVHMAQMAVNLLQKRGKPQGAYLADQLNQYRQKTTQAVGVVGSPFGGSVVVAAAQAKQAVAPALLRMALAPNGPPGAEAEKVSAEIYQERLRVCGTCERYTGLRCRVCGCFIEAKAWQPQEDCPLGKWGNQSG